MTAPLDAPEAIIYKWLLDKGLVINDTGAKWEGWIGPMPDDDTVNDYAISVNSQGGLTQGRLHNTGEVIENFAIVIRVRGKDYVTTQERAESTKLALDLVKNQQVTVGANVYTIASMLRTTPVVYAGVDPDRRRRHNFTLNFTIKLI